MFFEKLEIICKEKKTNPTAVLEKLGLSTGNISYWKKGKEPSGDIIIKFAKYFEISSDYLLGLSENPYKDKLNISLDELRLIEAYKKNKDMQEAVNRILKINTEQINEIKKIAE